MKTIIKAEPTMNSCAWPRFIFGGENTFNDAQTIHMEKPLIERPNRRLLFFRTRALNDDSSPKAITNMNVIG